MDIILILQQQPNAYILILDIQILILLLRSTTHLPVFKQELPYLCLQTHRFITLILKFLF